MSEKTLKQIADELGIEKQRVYRFVKKYHINEAHQSASGNTYDEVAQKLIKKHFEPSAHINNAYQNHINDALFDALFEQIKIKDGQISELQKALDQEQQLHAQSKHEIQKIMETNQQLLEYKENRESKSFWRRLFGN